MRTGGRQRAHRAWTRRGVLLLAALLPLAGQAATAPDLPVRLLFALRGFDPRSPFRAPEALWLSAGERALYVADAGNGEITVSSLQGVAGYRFDGGKGFAPISIASLDDGRLLVSDRNSGGIKVFSPTGKLQAELDLSQLSGIAGVRAGRLTVTRGNSLYCVDQAHGEVLVFDYPWKLRLRLGTKGSREQFKVPEDVAVDRFGRIYVSDSVGVPIRVFDRGGTYLFSIGRHGETSADLQEPTSLLMDRFDQLWVTDTRANQVVIYDRSGWALRKFGVFGQLEGQLFHPVDLALDGFGRIYLAEREGRRVQVFTYDQPLERFSR